MPTTLTPVDEHTADVNVPNDTEPANALSVRGAFQAITNRTHNHLGILTDHETRLDTIESYVPSLIPNDGTYTVASVDNETNIDAIAAGDVDGFYTYIGFEIGRTVTVYFFVPFAPTGSGLKSFEIPVPTAVTVATENFDSAADAFGTAVATVGTTTEYAAAQVYAVDASKKVKVEWYDTHASGVGIMRGSYTYRVQA